MQPAVQRLQAVLAEVQFKTPRVPVVSNVDAKPHSDPQEIKDILAKQVTSPVQWETIITTMVKSPDFTKAYEFGPGEVTKQADTRHSTICYITAYALCSVAPPYHTEY